MPTTDLSPLRTYKAPWRGELILACSKCQRKLKKHNGTKPFANLKKWFKRRVKAAEADAPNVRVVGIDCVKMCPKGGVTVARQQQLGTVGSEVSIVYAEADLERLYALVGRRQTGRKEGKTA